MNRSHSTNGTYHRYHIETTTAQDIVPWPSRFNVQVKRAGLAKLILREIVQYKGNTDVVLSRPCVYGVFSGPLGGFTPRERLCVGCLRCTTQYPEFVQISHNPQRLHLGDSYFTPSYVETVAYEAQSGRVPVRGAGYRGKFGGEGWDGMWTDMSEIVRPTRDGIHGREFISTLVDIGVKPNFLAFDDNGQPSAEVPNTFSIPLPMLLDVPPACLNASDIYKTFSRSAEGLQTLVFLPVRNIIDLNLRGDHIVPLITSRDYDLIKVLPFHPRMVAFDSWSPLTDSSIYDEVHTRFPETMICLRMPFISGEDLLAQVEAGIRVFHLTANYHGKSPDGTFIFDLIRSAHSTLVEAGIREEVTLLGSGGIIAAEHVPKAIIAGLDAVVLDTPLLVALQAHFEGEFIHRRAACKLPKQFNPEWGSQRLMNLVASWRDQLLEVLGAMGLREVRRLRGEMGRAMFQLDLERYAFGDIEGYPG